MVLVGTGTSGTRFLKTNWPITEGLDAGTTKQEGTTGRLDVEEENLISQNEMVGL